MSDEPYEFAEIEPNTQFWEYQTQCPNCDQGLLIPTFPKRFRFQFEIPDIITTPITYTRKGTIYTPLEEVPQVILVPYKLDTHGKAIDDLFKNEDLK